jgi:hypothetical protein
MIAISLWSPRAEGGKRLFQICLATGVAAGVLIASRASFTFYDDNQQEVLGARLQLPSVNPILVGQLGATLLTLSIWGLLRMIGKISVATKIMLVSAIITGAYLIIGANSKGPIVSMLSCLLFMVITHRRAPPLHTIGYLIAIVTASLFSAYYLESFIPEVGTLRIFESDLFSDEGSLGRIDAIRSSLDAFSKNPILGSSLETPIIGGYPHNIFAESLLTMGVGGAILLTSLLLITLLISLKIYFTNPDYGWASMLFIQYFIGSNFSGAIYTNCYLWIITGLIMAINSVRFSSTPKCSAMNCPRQFRHQ